MDILEVENVRKMYNWSKSDVSKFFGISQQSYNNWLTRLSIPKKYYEQTRWFITEKYESSMPSEQLREISLESISNPGNHNAELKTNRPEDYAEVKRILRLNSKFDYNSIGRSIPILSWDTVRYWERNVISNNLQQRGISACPVPCSNLTFALVIENDEMFLNAKDHVNFDGIGTPEGSLIFVDPVQRDSLNSDDKVIARYDREGEITFRNYKIFDNAEIALIPTNEDYNSYHDNIEIIGKDIGRFIKD